MKTIIAGSRTITELAVVERAVECSCINVSEVVCGCARGVDMLGYNYGKKRNIPVAEFPADWNKFGKSAGYKRNEQMAEYAEALVAIWDGQSKGTKHMIDIATKKGLRVYIYIPSPDVFLDA